MKLIPVVVALLLSDQALSEGFTAVCEADETHAYRNSLNLGSEWSSGEKFFSKWTFVFNGDDELLLDGDSIQILYWDEVSLIAVDARSGIDAASAWLYAFNLPLKDVVGSQVNSYQILGPGIKARSTNFKCEFTSHSD